MTVQPRHFYFLILGLLALHISVGASARLWSTRPASPRTAWMDRRLTGKRYVKKMLAATSITRSSRHA